MRPSTLKAGDKLIYRSICGIEHIAYFVRRQPHAHSRKADNYLRFPDFAGQDGPDDQGICVVSDYDLSRNARFAEGGHA